MPYPRKVSDEQRAAAFAEFKAANGARGTVTNLARKYNVTYQSMDAILKRAAREASQVSRETSVSSGGQS